MFCLKCGNKMSSGDLFCIKCGTKVLSSDSDGADIIADEKPLETMSPQVSEVHIPAAIEEDITSPETVIFNEYGGQIFGVLGTGSYGKLIFTDKRLICDPRGKKEKFEVMISDIVSYQAAYQVVGLAGKYIRPMLDNSILIHTKQGFSHKFSIPKNRKRDQLIQLLGKSSPLAIQLPPETRSEAKAYDCPEGHPHHKQSVRQRRIYNTYWKVFGIVVIVLLIWSFIYDSGSQEVSTDVPPEMSIENDQLMPESDSYINQTETSKTVTETSEPVEYYSAEFVGEWWDTWSDRCSMTIESGGINYYINIHWGSSAWDTTIWSFVGTYDNELGGIVYTGSCIDSHVSDDGEVQETIKYSDGTGFIYIEGDMLYWIDDVEGAGADCIFQRPLNEEIFVPDQTDLMMTDGVERENLWTVMDDNTGRNINLFFSNFAEMRFNYYSADSFDISSLISFAYLHNYFNYYESRFGLISDESGNYYEVIDVGYVSDAIKQFFDLDINPQSTENIGYDSDLNIYYTPAADGENIYLFAQVTGIYDNGDGTYDITYDVYYEPSDSISSIPQYAYDKLTDEQLNDFAYDSSLTATIKASNLYNRSTYRLLELYQQ